MNLLLIILANAITMLIDLATLYLAVRLFTGGGGFQPGRWSPASRSRVPTKGFSGLVGRVRRWPGFLRSLTRNQKLILIFILLFLLRCFFAVNIRIGA